MSFRIKIVTPSALAYEGNASEVVVPGFEGQYGVLPSHAQILTLSKPGVLSIFSIVLPDARCALTSACTAPDLRPKLLLECVRLELHAHHRCGFGRTLGVHAV